MPEPAWPLARFRVLELGDGVALAYLGKLFSDFGAEVVKLERPGGDPLRRQAPLVGTGSEKTSALFAWLTTNRRSLTADLASEAGLDLARRWLPGCDLLLDARPRAQREAAPLGHDLPHLVAAELSPFGDRGPYRDFRGPDSVLRALAGVFACTGPAGGPPSLLGGIAGEVTAAIAAFNGIAAALLAGQGRRLEVSLHEANIAVAEYQLTQSVTHPEIEQRLGVNRFAPTSPLGIYRCRQGWLGVTIVTPAQFRAFCAMIGLDSLGHDPRFVVGPDRLRHAEELEALFLPRLAERTAEEWFAEAIRRRLPFAVVPDMATLLATETHRARGAFATVEAGLARFEGPALPQRLTRTPPRATGRAPAPGADDGMPAPAPRPVGTRAAPGSLPLAGTRIIDLSMGWAGPVCTRQLADLGAEVIKVEACQYPDWWRGVDPRPAFFAERRYEKDIRFCVQNRNKAGITLDLTTPEGAALLKALVRSADAVVENYAREVLPKLHLDYPVLAAENPSIVMLSMPAFGLQGPWRDARAYGSTLEHASGLPSVAGEAHWPPTTSQLAYGDPIGGLNAAAALLTALLHRAATGEGQQIDLAQVECMFPLVAPWIVAQSATGSPGPRLGNRHPAMVPHGAFPGADGEWLVVAAEDDAAWSRLAALAGLATAGCETLAGRRADEARIEMELAAWTRSLPAAEAMARLQAAGVAAGTVTWPSALKQDPHLAARGFFQRIDRAFTGPHDQPSAPFREAGGAPYPVRRPAPTLGEDNARILGALGADLQALARQGIIGTEAIPTADRKKKAQAA
ncbi:hypothetical protein BKE38_05545 [Pseudoroseomonas deserti]|uniref:CoA transferase n=1 Tax=Teichococcus deserti TaxID=1817963 RepID=A0A1V2H6H4_9PROT|nr:CoA transferase [Pseudoroseomonas deserti]ONG56630.1 hypothetical protein BKE38_05545 [Pseudoroseomonas deserti]